MIEVSLIWALRPKNWKLGFGSQEALEVDPGEWPCKAWAVWLLFLGVQLTVYYLE